VKKGIVRIEITIKTPSVTVTQWFDRADYPTNEEWVKTAKEWIKKDEGPCECKDCDYEWMMNEGLSVCQDCNHYPRESKFKKRRTESLAIRD